MLELPIYNKLVRDKILEIMDAQGKTYNARVLDSEEYSQELKKKFQEEVNEFIEAKTDVESMEELADLLELIYAALGAQNKTMDELEKVRLQKKEKRGGFEQRLFLIDGED